ncbi:MAG TPA: SH3 domain-containing protein [Chloroflexota bacterium]|nr:SH3 domain-containing protein [Chloroflexota bacterium]HUM69216.1 SH3 domain-containing protein [Chloroflexota bacterium]
MEPSATPTTVFVAIDLPTATATLPPTATPIPTDTPIPPSPTFTRTPTNTPTPTPTNTPTETPTMTPTPECIGAFPTRLTVGDRAKVINYQLNVRTGPGTNYPLVSRLSVDREVTVLEGPQCSNGQLWYHIKSDVYRTSAGNQVQVEGWSVEESGNVYYLAPIN